MKPIKTWKRCAVVLLSAAGVSPCLLAQAPAPPTSVPMATAPAGTTAEGEFQPETATPEQVKGVVKLARQLLNNKDLTGAEDLAKMAMRARSVKYSRSEDSPGKILAEVDRVRRTTGASRPGVEQKIPQTPGRSAAELLVQARKKMEQGEFNDAERLTYEAEALRPVYNVWFRGDRPDKLRQEIINKRRQASKTGGKLPNEPYSRSYRTPDSVAQQAPVTEVLPGNTLYQSGVAQAQFAPVEARPYPMPTYRPIENLTPPYSQVENLTPRPIENLTPPYRPIENLTPPYKPVENLSPMVENLSPMALTPRTDNSGSFVVPGAPVVPAPLAEPMPPAGFARLNADQARDQAQQLLVQARGHLSRCEYAEALRLANQVKSMGLTFATPNEDSPEAIIEATYAQQKMVQAHENAQAAADAAKHHALVRVAEARLHQKDGRLLDALHSAQEALRCGARIDSANEKPEVVIAELQHACRAQVESLANAAQGFAARGQYQQAQSYLLFAYELASGFQMDARGLDAQLTQVHQLQRQPAVNPPTPVRSPTSPAPLVSQPSLAPVPVPEEPIRLSAPLPATRTEMTLPQLPPERRTNNPTSAPTATNEVVPASPSVPWESGSTTSVNPPSPAPVSFNLDSNGQVRMNPDLAYDLAVRAYTRKDYAVAVSYLQNIDLRVLDPRKRAQAQEMLTSRSMQMPSRGVVQASNPPYDGTGTEPVGRATVTDHPGAALDQGLINQVKAHQAVQLQKLEAQKQQSEQEASRLAGRLDYDGAIHVLQETIDSIKRSELDPELTAGLLRDLEMRLKRYDLMRKQAGTQQSQQQEEKDASSVGQRRAMAKEHQKEQVDKLMQQYRDFTHEGKFLEAEMAAKKALEIEPASVEAAAGIEMAKTKRSLAQEGRALGNKERGIAGALNAAIDSSAPMDDRKSVVYSDDWSDIDKRKGKKKPLPIKIKTPQDRETENKLNYPVSVEFKNKPLGEALDELQANGNVNMVIDMPELEKEGVSLSHPISMRLDSTPLKVVLKNVLENAQLTYVIRDGIIKVTTRTGAKGDQVKATYSVADLVIPIDNSAGGVGNNLMNNPTGMPAGNFNVAYSPSPWRNTSNASGTTVGSTSAGKAGTHEDKEPETPQQAMVNRLIKLITETTEPASWDTMGGSGHIDYYPQTLSLVISQTPDIQEQVELLLQRLRELQDLQVTVEVRFITLDESFFERIGIDFDVEIDDDQTRFDNQVATNNFAPAGFINEPDHLDNVVVGLTPQGTLTSDLDIPLATTSFDRAIPPFGGFNGVGADNGGISMGLAFLSDIEVFLLLEAAQGSRRTNIMQAPKLTLFNGQSANLSVSSTRFFVTNFDVVQDFFGNATLIPVNTPFPSTTSLTVQATVSADRRYVRLFLTPFISNVDPQAGQFQVQTPAGPQFVQQPTTTQVNVSTTVSVPDGGTILLGGLKSLSEGRTEFGPPILNKMPYINRLFKNIGYGRETRSFMMMVTPRIIIPEEEEERLNQTFNF